MGRYSKICLITGGVTQWIRRAPSILEIFKGKSLCGPHHFFGDTRAITAEPTGFKDVAATPLLVEICFSYQTFCSPEGCPW